MLFRHIMIKKVMTNRSKSILIYPRLIGNDLIDKKS